MTTKRPHRPRETMAWAFPLTIMVASLTATAPLVFAQTQDPDAIDCKGPAPDAEPGSAAWFARDATNMACAEQRHADKALHPVLPLPIGPPLQERGRFVDDPYREPSRHAGTRFRFDETTVTTPEGEALAVEVYRPCASGTCRDQPEALEAFEPPYPAVISIHGGASRKELHWWSSQPLAESGYMVVSFDDATTGTSPTSTQVEAITEWLLATPDDPTAAGEHNQFWDELARDRIGMAGHSAGGVLASRLGQEDSRVSAIVSWDRAQSSPLPADIELNAPTLFQFADYNCQQVPVCQPEPYLTPPNPDGPGNKGDDFLLLREAGVDTMQIALRAATHLDWTPPVLAGSRYGEIMSLYYTLAWFDRYLKGAHDPNAAKDAFERLAALEFDDSADIHNISQGFFDPLAADNPTDPFDANVPYRIMGMPVADRLSFYFRSKCFLTVPPGTGGPRAESEDMRVERCETERAGLSHLPQPSPAVKAKLEAPQ